MRSLPLLSGIAVFAALLTSCGGGDGVPDNPAPTPIATTSIAMDGYWMCDFSSVTETNTVDTYEFEPGDVIQIFQGQLFGDNAGDPWLRADIEQSLGFPLDWYYNAASGSMLDYQGGWDRLADGAGTYSDYVNYGLRLAATGPDQLSGYESRQAQETATAPRTQWTAALSFVRVLSLPVENATGEPGRGDESDERHKPKLLSAKAGQARRPSRR